MTILTILNLLNYEDIGYNITKEIVRYLPEDFDIKKIVDIIINFEPIKFPTKSHLLFEKYKDKFHIDDLKKIIKLLFSHIDMYCQYNDY